MIPNNFDGKWPRSTIDFVHANIVDKSCQIRVNNDYLDERSSDVVKPCTVFIEDLNIQLNDYMIREKLAKYAELNTIDRYLKDLDANKEQQMIVEDVNEREQLFLRMEHEVVQMKHDELLSSLHRDREVDANEDETKRLMRATGHDSDDQMSDDCQVVERHVVSINLSSSDDDMERGPTYKNVFPKDSSSKFEHQDSIFKFNEDDLKMLDIQKMKLMVSFARG